MTTSLFCYLLLLITSFASKLGINVTLHFSKLTKPPNLQSREINLLPHKSFTRSRYLKQQKYNSFTSEIAIVPTENAALIELSFGTPPQSLLFVLDTASSLTWFPCGSNSHQDPIEVKKFDPSLSGSSKYISCSNPKRGMFSAQEAHDQCKNCKANNSNNCFKPIKYQQLYGKGSANGLLLLEELMIQQQIIPNFIVGCSSSFASFSNGIAGFGRRFESLPSQLRIKKFSYCIPISHSNYNTLEKGYLILNGVSRSNGVRYTSFHTSPHSSVSDGHYYYVILTEVIIGRKSIKIPRKFFVPGFDGRGGTILDSGTTTTYFESSIFRVVVKEFERQLGKNTFIGNVDNTIPCFNVSGKQEKALPKIALRFKDDRVMSLQRLNYLVDSSHEDIVCMSIMNKPNHDPRKPSIILGNLLQRNFYIEHDLVKERFGFKAEKCTS